MRGEEVWTEIRCTPDLVRSPPPPNFAHARRRRSPAGLPQLTQEASQGGPAFLAKKRGLLRTSTSFGVHSATRTKSSWSGRISSIAIEHPAAR